MRLLHQKVHSQQECIRIRKLATRVKEKGQEVERGEKEKEKEKERVCERGSTFNIF